MDEVVDCLGAFGLGLWKKLWRVEVWGKELLSDFVCALELCVELEVLYVLVFLRAPVWGKDVLLILFVLWDVLLSW